MSIDIALETMTVPEKVQLLERVWADLCKQPEEVRSPEWHAEILEERRRRLEDGAATVSNWSEAKQRLLDLGK